MNDRIRSTALLSKVMSADEAALFIKDGMTLAISGFAAIGAPKAVPLAIAKRAESEPIHLDIISGASASDEADGALSRAGVVTRKYPYMSNKDMRALANSNRIHYVDMHLSSTPHFIKNGYFGHVDVAIVEGIAITENGGIVPSLSVGISNEAVLAADKVIIEINTADPLELEGIHDIYTVKPAPNTQPIPITATGDRIGTTYIPCDPEKVVAVVLSDTPNTSKSMKPADEDSKAIARNIISFLKAEMAAGRLPDPLPPLQSGVGNVGNAILDGFAESGFKGLNMYSEVMQDAVAKLILTGTVSCASACAFTLSPEFHDEFYAQFDKLKGSLILRPQEISNSPEVIRRLGVIAINTALEVDLAGNVNSTHVNGTKVMNGLGGSGDYTRNAGLCIFSTQSTAKNGTLSCVVPTVSHVDHTDHDTMIIVTEQGVADLRGKDAFERAELMIENCAHPKFRPALRKYLEEAKAGHDKHYLPPMPCMKLEAEE